MSLPSEHAKIGGVFMARAAVIFLLLLASFAATADVRNVRVEQQGSRVWVTYDLEEARATEVSALVAVRDKLLLNDTLHVGGDIGREVAPGKDKRFFWDVPRDFPAGLAGEVSISVQAVTRRTEQDLTLSDQQAEVFRRIEAEGVDVAAANRGTRFEGVAAKLANTIDETLNRSYYRAVDSALLGKARYYCARFTDEVGTRALVRIPTQAPEDIGPRWEAAKRATPVIDERNHAKYFNCVLTSLDPHSAYLTPDELSELRSGSSGVFVGLGIELAMEGGRPKVVSPIDGSPALLAGIKAGDIIDTIDDAPTTGLSLSDVVKRIRGKPDTRVTLTIERAGEPPIVMTITRALVKVQSVRAKPLDGGYGYLRISQFQEKTAEMAIDALERLARDNGGPPAGIVLDLRDDPGGLLNVAARVAGIFLNDGQTIVSTEGRNAEGNMKLTVQREGKAAPAWARTVPLAVLVNKGSASASEIVTGALQDHRRAVVVGQRTFGKGSVQTITPLDGGGATKLTTALYFTPAGRTVQRNGIVPDVAIEQDAASHDDAAAFGRRVLMTPGVADPELRSAAIDALKIAEFRTLYKNAARSAIAIAGSPAAAPAAPVAAAPVKPAAPVPAAAAVAAAAIVASPAIANDIPAGQNRVALVIGNAAYPTSPLRNPVSDARAVSAKLKKLGFQVTMRENAGFKDMMRAVTQFGERLAQKGTVGLFYYAGHGMQVQGRNYLIPVDAQITGEASVRSEAVDADSVLVQMAASELGIVILDACRNNPFERRFRGGGGGLAQIDAPKGTLIAYATAPGKVASDGEGQNGLYTQELLRVLDKRGLKVEDVFKRVRRQVAEATGDLQVPWESSSLTGDFYFAGAEAVASAATQAADPELVFWQSVKDSQDREDLAAYLRKYPNGQFVDLAKNRLRKIKVK